MNSQDEFLIWKKSWRMQGGTIQGRSHTDKGIPCQDKIAYFQLGETYVIALADGAGSAEHSDVGADIAVNAVCDYLASNFDNIIKIEDAVEAKACILEKILSALREKASDSIYDLKSLASTMLFVAVKGECCLIGHIGDGVICCIKEDCLKVISSPSNGEFVNTTTFTTSSNAMSDFRLYKTKIGQLQAFCLMSDGAAESLYNRKTHELAYMVKKIFAATISLPPDRSYTYIDKLLNDLLVHRTRDDCSLVVMAKANTASLLLNMNDEGFSSLLELPKGRSCRAMRELVVVLSNKPATKYMLKRRLHVKAKAISRRLNILISNDFVYCSNGKYYMR